MRSSMIPLIGAALGGAAITATLAANSCAQPAPVPASLEASLERVANGLGGLERRVAALEARPSATQPERRAATIEPTPQAPAVLHEASNQPATADPLHALVDQVAREEFSEAAMHEFLTAVRTQNVQDGVIEAIKARLANNPGDARMHYLLARAYEERLMSESTPAGFEHWGNLVMSEYDAALGADPRYWEPRFAKAKSLTYYPESEGKGPIAIRELETLVAQQKRSNKDARFATTYLLLARMYLRVGNKDKALATLEEGLAVFPQGDELRQQLEVMRQ